MIKKYFGIHKEYELDTNDNAIKKLEAVLSKKISNKNHALQLLTAFVEQSMLEKVDLSALSNTLSETPVDEINIIYNQLQSNMLSETTVSGIRAIPPANPYELRNVVF